MKKIVIRILPLLSIAITVLAETLIPDSAQHTDTTFVKQAPYLTYVLLFLGGVYAVFFVLSFWIKKIRLKIDEKAPLWTGAVQLINLINLITAKFALLPVLFFPSLDRIFGVFVEDRVLLLQCIGSSFQLLITGFVIGGLLGFFCGILIGFNKKANYWISPVTKIIGPIPAMSWSPLVLSLFATPYQASVFLVALATWFPITLMTSSGIQNIKNTYFEVASTLGAKTLYRVFKVGVPAAMPSIFLGVFYATVNAFVTLVSAEMFGAASGIGWYLNWTKSVMQYYKVYAGLIILAGICNIVITLLFKVRGKLLKWQEGVIKW